jgi:octaprenyl-diphosphate synthase
MVPVSFAFLSKVAANTSVHAPMGFPLTVLPDLEGAVFFAAIPATAQQTFTLNRLSPGQVTALGTITVTPGSRTGCTLAGPGGRLAVGEVLQLVTSNDTETSEQSYLEVIRCKTAALFAAACRIGAVIGNRPKVEEEALESFGLNLGIAFQLVDDVLDYAARETELGKSIGDDFRDGKITLPVILAYRRGNEIEREFWRRTLESSEATDTDLEHAIGLMTKHRALEDTITRARHYGAIAKDALALFPGSPMKEALEEAVEFCIARST